MKSPKSTTLGLLKIKVFSNKRYDFIVSLDGITNKIVLQQSSYIADKTMLPKFGNSRCYCNLTFMKSSPQKPIF